MSVFVDRAGVWIFDFWEGGKRYKRRAKNPDGTPAASRRQAQAAEDMARVAARNERRGQAVAAAGDYTLAQAVAARSAEASRMRSWSHQKIELAEIVEFFGAGAAIERVAETWKAYRDWMRRQTVKVWLGGPKKNRDHDDTRLWRDTGRPRSPGRINRYLNQLSAVLRLAHETRGPDKLPLLSFMPAIELEEVDEHDPNPVPLAVLAAIELDTETPQHLRDAAALSRLFGLRLTEAMRAETSWIDFGDAGLRVPAKIAKAKRDRYQPANDEGMALLRRLAADVAARAQPIEKGAETRLIVWRVPGKDEDGQLRPARAIKNPRRAWGTALNRFGVKGKWRFHDVRARYVTEAFKATSPAVARDLAAHKDQRTSDRYIAIAGNEKRDAVAAMPDIRSVAPAQKSPTAQSHRAKLRRVK
ncbi:MAG: tyrosine-type recombinase/integrase [Tagaea sp.]|nr:tyrosine-type recombinase/integrase [Tagaea sp.]